MDNLINKYRETLRFRHAVMDTVEAMSKAYRNSLGQELELTVKLADMQKEMVYCPNALDEGHYEVLTSNKYPEEVQYAYWDGQQWNGVGTLEVVQFDVFQIIRKVATEQMFQSVQ